MMSEDDSSTHLRDNVGLNEHKYREDYLLTFLSAVHCGDPDRQMQTT